MRDSVQVQNLETVNSVLKELEEKTGQYGLSIDTSNQLIEQQVKIWRQAGVPEEYINQLKEIRQLENSREGWDGALLGTREYFAQSTNLARGFRDLMTSSFSSMEDALVSFTSTGKLSFTDMVNGMVSDLARLAVRQSVTGPLAGALSFGMGGASSWFSGLLSASGNVFSGGDLSRYSNSIVTTPTLFEYDSHVSRFARGAGLMAEAGPEAVMPLVRSSGGYLGVRAIDSGNTQDVVVNVYNYGNEKATVNQTSTSDGGKRIDVIIGDMVARQMNTPGTRLNRAVSNQTGATYPVVRR